MLCAIATPVVWHLHNAHTLHAAGPALKMTKAWAAVSKSQAYLAAPERGLLLRQLPPQLWQHAVPAASGSAP